MAETNSTRGRWVRTVLLIGIPAMLSLALTSRQTTVRWAFLVAAAMLSVALLGLWLDRITDTQAVVVLLAVAGLMYGVGAWSQGASDAGPVEVGFFGFRAMVLVSGVVFLALGPRAGVFAGSALIVISLVVMGVLGVPVLGSDDTPVGLLQAGGLMAAVLAIYRSMSVRVEHLEQSAEEASESAELAFRDELTGLPNRRQLTIHLSASAARAREGGAADAVVMFDLDHFKRINDTLGHDVGDEVLRRTAAIASAAVREADIVGRWGGEEFVALLDGAEAEEAVRVAERCREALASVPGRASVTASFGITTMSVDDTVTDALRRADLALYEAKQAGRDRVVVFQPKAVDQDEERVERSAAVNDDHPRRDWPGAAKPR